MPARSLRYGCYAPIQTVPFFLSKNFIWVTLSFSILRQQGSKVSKGGTVRVLTPGRVFDTIPENGITQTDGGSLLTYLLFVVSP